ncbi:MAG: hypothetical protein ACEPOV_06275 [Hyphomicrobiales bacterium]
MTDISTQKLKKEINFLRVYSLLLTVVILFIFYLIYNPIIRGKYHDIDVERINVKETDGSLKMVISNSMLQHSGVVDGVTFERERPAGIIFFNSHGDECGGLIYDGNNKEAGFVLSVDEYKEDQVMQLQYIENTADNQKKYGMQLWEHPVEVSYKEKTEKLDKAFAIKDPDARKKAIAALDAEGLITKERLFVGKHFNDEVGLFIQDEEGNTRIKIYVDKDNQARIEVLDKDGNTVK